jgi:hypothetical protein
VVEIAEHTGEEPRRTVRLSLTADQYADFCDRVTALRKERPQAELGELVVEGLRQCPGCSGGPGSSSYRMVIHTCEHGEKFTRETPHGTVEIPREDAERHACDTEILDIRKGPAPIRRTMPPSIANFVDVRDKGRCAVPGCSHRTFVDRHHEGGWRRVAHDPKFVYLLCTDHHKARHLGLLTVELDNGERIFHLADGANLTNQSVRRSTTSRVNEAAG